MTYPVRGLIHTTLDHGFQDPSEMKLRDLVEYYKRIARLGDELGTPTGLELKAINQAYQYVVSVVATREQIPAGWLMMTIQELARSEMRALDLAEGTHDPG